MTLSTDRLPAIALRTPLTAADQAAFDARLAQVPDDSSHEISVAITRIIQQRAVGLLDAVLARKGCRTQIVRRLINQSHLAWFEAIVPRLEPSPTSDWLPQAITTAAEHQQLPWLLKVLPGLDLPARHLTPVLMRAAENGRLDQLAYVLDRMDEDTTPAGRTAKALAWGSAVRKALTHDHPEAVQALLARAPKGDLHRVLQAVALSGTDADLDRVVAQSTIPVDGHIRRTLTATASSSTLTLAQAQAVADRLALRFLPPAAQHQIVAQFPGALVQTLAHLRAQALSERPAGASPNRRRRT